MNILIYLIIAALIGSIATDLMHDRSNLLINTAIAVIGAVMAGYLLSPIFHAGTINQSCYSNHDSHIVRIDYFCWQSSG
jgi:uncharacterized membrane protein YeaQ/YmgE (transglycosylase-associated protein family)